MKPYLIALIATMSAALVAEDRSKPSPPGTTIVAKLEQIVSLRQQAAKQHALQVNANRKTYDLSYDLDLARAELDLARERHSDLGSLKALNQIADIRRKALEGIKLLATEDRAEGKAVTEASVALLQAEIDVERETQRQKAAKK